MSHDLKARKSLRATQLSRRIYRTKASRTFELYRLRRARERLDFRVFLSFKVETDESAQQPCLPFLYSVLPVSTSMPFNFDLTPILGKEPPTQEREMLQLCFANARTV